MKNYLFLSAVSVMMLAACSNDDTVPLEGPGSGEAGPEIVLSINSGGGGMGVRGSRPVNSSEAANNVTAVQLYIYNEAGTDVTSTALATGTQNPVVWTAGPSDSAVPGDNPNPAHKASQTVKLKKLSPDGIYTVVAYGYNNVADYTISGGGNGNDAFTATPVVTPLTTEAELFAGKATFTVSNGNIQTGTNVEVELHRHVAGLLGYFKNVPILYPNPNAAGVPTLVAFVRVYAPSYSSALTFPSALTMNGTGGAVAKTKVLEVNLVTYITDYAAQTLAAAGDLTKNFIIPVGTSPVTVENSVLTGRFLVPFAKVAGSPTFTVQLEDVTGAVLKSWDVVNNALGVGTKEYDVQRNYFYSLGQKYKASSTDGGTPGPGTTEDDDNPINLSQETVITVTVNDAWNMIYNLGLE